MVSAQDFISELRTRKVLSDKHIVIIEQSLLQPADEIPASDLADYLVEQMVISAAVSGTILAHLRERENRPLRMPNNGIDDKIDDEIQRIDGGNVVNLVPTSRPVRVKSPKKTTMPETPPAPRPSIPQPPPARVQPVIPASPPPPKTPPEPPDDLRVGMGDDEKTPLMPEEAGRRIKTTKRENPWDTLLVRYGVIALGLLVLASVVLVWLLMQRRADEVLAVADEAYQNGSYTQAMEGYKDFIKSFESNANVPKAKLRVALSKIRLITETKSNWDKALACVREELPEMSRLPDFAGEGRIELSAILPNIAEGLAAMADKTDNADWLRQSETALALIEEHVPNTMQPFHQLQTTRRSLELTRRRIARDSEIVTLQAEITDMLDAIKATESTESAESGDAATLRRQFAECYALLMRYLHAHPEIRDSTLVAAIKSDIARTEALCQKWASHSAVPADATAVSGPPMPVMLLTHRVGPPLDDSSDAGTPARLFVGYANQNAYAINPASGTIAWRHHVGQLGLDRNAPLIIPGLPNNTTLLADERNNALLMVDNATGTERLRISTDETAFINSQPMWPINFVTTPGGKLMLVNLVNGERLGHVDLMQDANAPPGYDPERQLVVQPAQHSALHVFRYDDQANVPLTNIGIVPTGHLSGTIQSAPIVHKGCLLVAEQTAPTRSTIKIFAPTVTGHLVPWSNEPVQVISLDGLVKSPPLVDDNDLLYMAERGDVKLISFVGNDQAKPYQIVAEGRIDDSQNRDGIASGRFASLAGRSLWVADNRLQRFEVQPSRSRLIPQSVPQTPAIVSQSPLEIADNHLTQTFVDPVMGGVVARSFALPDHADRWRTEFGEGVLAHPLVTGATTDGGTLHLVTSTGKLYDIPLDILTAQRDTTLCNTETYMRQRVAPGTLTEPVTDLVPLENGREVLCCLSPNTEMTNLPASSAIRVYDGNSPQSLIRTITVPAPLTSAAVPLGQGIVVPLANGQLAFYSPADGTVIGNPFITRRTQDAPPHWSPMTLISQSERTSDTDTDDVSQDTAILIGDANGLLRQIELVTQNNRPSLVMTKSLQLPIAVTAKPLVCGRNIVITDNAGRLMLFDYDLLTAEGNVLHQPILLSELLSESTASQEMPQTPTNPAAFNRQYGGVIVTGNVEPQADSPFVVNTRLPRGTADSSNDEQPSPDTQPTLPSAINVPYQTWELDGAIVWGPFSCGSGGAIAVTDQKTFITVTQADQPMTVRGVTLREQPLEHGLPVGRPTVLNETQLLFVTRKGTLVRYDHSQDTLTPIIETGVAPSCGPILVQSKMIVVGVDGAIYAF